MKRILSIVLSCFIIFALSSCAGGNRAVSEGASGEHQSAAAIKSFEDHIASEEKWSDPVSFAAYENRAFLFQPAALLKSDLYYLSRYSIGTQPNSLIRKSGTTFQTLLKEQYALLALGALPDGRLALEIQEPDEGAAAVCSYGVYDPATNAFKVVTPAEKAKSYYRLCGIVNENAVLLDSDAQRALIQDAGGQKIDTFSAAHLTVYGDQIYGISTDRSTLFVYDPAQKKQTVLLRASQADAKFSFCQGVLVEQLGSSAKTRLYRMDNQQKICEYPTLEQASVIGFDSNSGVVYFRSNAENGFYTLTVSTGILQKHSSGLKCYAVSIFKDRVYYECSDDRGNIDLYQ